MLIQRSSPGCGRSFCRAFIISSTPCNRPVPHSSLWSSAYVYINLPHIRVTPASHQLLSLLPWRRKGQATAAGKGVGWGLVASSKRGEQQELRHAGGAPMERRRHWCCCWFWHYAHVKCDIIPAAFCRYRAGNIRIQVKVQKKKKKPKSLARHQEQRHRKTTLSPMERPRVKPICHQECVVLTKHQQILAAAHVAVGGQRGLLI